MFAYLQTSVCVCVCVIINPAYTVSYMCVCTSAYAFTEGMFLAPSRETDPTYTSKPFTWSCPGILGVSECEVPYCIVSK